MNIYTLLILAWKNLWSHRLRTFLTVGGMAIGAGSIVFLLSLGFGLERLVTERVADFEAFRIIEVPSANLRTGKIIPADIAKIKLLPDVTTVTEEVDLAGRLRLATQDSTTETVVVSTDPEYFQLSSLAITAGDKFNYDDPASIVINETLAGLLGYSDDPTKAVGVEVVLDLVVNTDLRPDGQSGPLVINDIPLKVIGLVKEGKNPHLYSSLKLATDKGIILRSSIKVQVENRIKADIVRKQIENYGYTTEYVGDTVEQIGQVFSLFRVVLAGFGMIALVVAALGAFNTLTISLMERIKEIGLLKTIGIRSRDLFYMLVLESVFIGWVGGMIGVGISSLAGRGLNSLMIAAAERAGADVVTVYYSPPGFLLTVSIGALVVGFITGFYPGIRAVRTNALDVLRYE